MIWRFKLWCSETKEKLVMDLVWLLPRQVIYWAGIRILASATRRSVLPPDRIFAFDALDEWDVLKRS